MGTSLRVAVTSAAVALLAVPLIAQSATEGHRRQTPAVIGLLERARVALGGDEKLSAIRSFTVSGSTEWGVPEGHSPIYGHFEIACELPSSFALTTHMPEPDTGRRVLAADGLTPIGNVGPTTIGFYQGQPIDVPMTHTVQAPHSRPSVAPVEVAPSALDRNRRRAREEFVRLTLGMFAASFDGVPVTFEAVPDDSNALWVIGLDERRLLVFDPATHLPARFGDSAYSDYRLVDGVRVPFRLTHEAGAYRDVWSIRSVHLNAPISPKAFGR